MVERTPGDQLARDHLLERLEADLVGPTQVDEWILDRPSDRYLTGILYAADTAISAEEDDDAATETSDAEAMASDVGVTLHNTLRPSSAGISFTVRGEGDLTVRLEIHAARYELGEGGLDQETTEQSEDDGDAQPKTVKGWKRVPVHAVVDQLRIAAGSHTQNLAFAGNEPLQLHTRCVLAGGDRLVTVALVNSARPEKGRVAMEEAAYFQVSLEILPLGKTRIVRRHSTGGVRDEDGRIGRLIYRNAPDFAVGHTCSADWSVGEDGTATRVATSWIPRSIVPAMSADGDEVFRSLGEKVGVRPLSTAWIAEAGDDELTKGLAELPAAYERWLKAQEDEQLPHLEGAYRLQATTNISTARAAIERMRRSIDLLSADASVRTAFRLSARAMRLQRRWARGDEDLVWRPFQLGFQLLTLSSLAEGQDPDRGTMDLLWFPTGGGKTEAYLGLTAFTFFLRRLRRGDSDGDGVTVLMRYTLRALTIDQFQRATALVMACESIRRAVASDGVDLGTVPFAIGLWVGGSATPNTVKEALDRSEGRAASYKQIRTCPACKSGLSWAEDRTRSTIDCACRDESCEFSAASGGLPIWTVDELVYRHKPSLVIGTIDKFAQITRKADTGVLLGVGTQAGPPDLIIQDELHLISGPLGTLTALYEIAVDALCEREGVPVKVIGSTATIRRAGDQIRNLFNRSTYQFPAPVIDADNSCFAVVDRSAPGRLYAAVSTVGRSPKFTLQAVSASLLQSAGSRTIRDDERDPYWTLVAYFNALRELGGALVLMEDDVRYSMEGFATRRDGEVPRELAIIEEMTSRRDTDEIQLLLNDLKTPYGDDGAVDVLLASSMISVGVDVPRLGLMVMNGQPKGVSEYIQATSRVGRGDTPGLIVAIYNNGRVRDRAYYETFPVWHHALYRDVEATSVTPFASRAIDRALHAVLVALVRHRVPALRDRPTLDAAKLQACKDVARVIANRAAAVEPGSVDQVERHLQHLLDVWEGRQGLSDYWNDFGRREQSLLISAEQAAALGAVGGERGHALATPNSMREVEPSAEFFLGNRPRQRKDNDGTGE